MRTLLYSGGLDSLIAWYYLDRPDTLYLDLDHRYNGKELEGIKQLEPQPTILKSYYGQYFEDDDAHLPGRNLLLGMYAAARGADKIYLVAQAGEQGIPDRTPEFFDETSKILSFHYNRDIELINPFPHMTKFQMVEWFLSEGYDPEWLKKSVSCYQRRPGQCGECGACFRKYAALELNNIASRWDFVEDVLKWGFDNYADKLDSYTPQRKIELERLFSQKGLL